MHEDQIHLQKDYIQRKESEENKIQEKNNEGKIREKERRKTNIYAKKSDVRRALDSKQPMIILRYKEALLNTNANDSLSSGVVSLAVLCGCVSRRTSTRITTDSGN